MVLFLFDCCCFKLYLLSSIPGVGGGIRSVWLQHDVCWVPSQEADASFDIFCPVNIVLSYDKRALQVPQVLLTVVCWSSH